MEKAQCGFEREALLDIVLGQAVQCDRLQTGQAQDSVPIEEIRIAVDDPHPLINQAQAAFWLGAIRRTAMRRRGDERGSGRACGLRGLHPRRVLPCRRIGVGVGDLRGERQVEEQRFAAGHAIGPIAHRLGLEAAAQGGRDRDGVPRGCTAAGRRVGATGRTAKAELLEDRVALSGRQVLEHADLLGSNSRRQLGARIAQPRQQRYSQDREQGRLESHSCRSVRAAGGPLSMPRQHAFGLWPPPTARGILGFSGGPCKRAPAITRSGSD